MGEPSPAEVRSRLLAWYAANRRDLPWRRTRDPYRILVAEYLLQRTRIASGTPYYERFLTRFPTVHDLAAASLDDVLAVWEGLGFYGRAKRLHAAARVIVVEHAGKVPPPTRHWPPSPELARTPLERSRASRLASLPRPSMGMCYGSSPGCSESARTSRA